MVTRSRSARPVVALVDDDPEVLRSLTRLLRTEPYELLSTNRPAQVLEWAAERTIDLVIADQRMPDMTGTELLALLRQRSPGTRGVILSGYPDTAVIVEQSHLRIEKLLVKPWDNGPLKATIRGILEGRSDDGAEELLEIKVDCAGRTAGLVLAEILPACRRASQGPARARIVVENLLMLQDSVSRLLKDLARAVVYLELPIELRDASGCITAFLNALDERTPVR